MSGSGKDKCPRCGALVPAASTGKPCPACLLSGALERTSGQTETMSLTPGETLSRYGPSHFPCEFGDYQLLGLLGRGGMGTVYEAEHRPTGRRLALKTLGQQFDSPEMQERFLREGRLAARVNHPNSLYVFGSEEIDGLPVITMEIAGGGTLKDKLRRRGPLPVAEAVDAILDVIAGLESASAHGVLHRDIKPSNCFLRPDGSVKVGDFGLSVSTLAKSDTFVTAPGRIMGTPAFASPEQLRGDTLDVRADIYSVGATLFTLLTNRAPFEGDNVVQVVANAVNQQPPRLDELRSDVPPGLARVVTRCLAKEPGGRYADYRTLRNELLPFSSREPEPASMVVRVSAGWIDYLLAFLPPYLALMFSVGAEDLLVRPLVERTLYSARYYFLLLGVGFLYFTFFEGIWGAGLGNWLKGLRVIRTNGRPPGFARAFLRIFIPVLCMEGVRMPLMLTFISTAQWSGLQTALYVLGAVGCGWIPALLALRARKENGFATLWDLATGTRVVIKPEGTARPAIGRAAQLETPAGGSDSLGPYLITGEIAPGEWIAGTDPVLYRHVWLLRRTVPELARARRDVARPGRLRWLQKVVARGFTWDAFEAPQGAPFLTLLAGGKRVPWSSLRHWLHDLALELSDAKGDHTIPAELSLDHVWVTSEGRAILLDQPWPEAAAPAEPISVASLAGQQRFLHAVADRVEPFSVPIHARPVLENLRQGKFEKLSFLAGTLRGLLNRPAEVGRGIRAGSVYMLPLYLWIAVFVGRFHDKSWNSSMGRAALISVLAVLGVVALIQLIGIPFRSTVSHFIFRLAVVNANGDPADASRLLLRWAIAWLPLIIPTLFLAPLLNTAGSVTALAAVALLVLWIGATVYAVVHPRRGLHDRLGGTWIVRR